MTVGRERERKSQIKVEGGGRNEDKANGKHICECMGTNVPISEYLWYICCVCVCVFVPHQPVLKESYG